MRERGQAGRRDGSEPRPLDVNLRQTLGLLEAVRQEEQVLAQLRRCVAELEAISRARSALVGRTDAELAEAAAVQRSRPDLRADAARELDR